MVWQRCLPRPADPEVLWPQVHLADLAEIRVVADGAVADLPAADRAAVDRYRGGRRVLAVASRLFTRTVLGRALGREPAAVPLTVDEWGRPRLAGRERFGFTVSHDSAVLVVALGPHPCGVDVEDAAEAALAEVRHRFCGTDERPDSARECWVAKESAAKALGRGLRAGLSTIRFAGNPAVDWSPVTWRGRRTPLRTRAVDLGGRHFALTARVGRAPDIEVHTWAPRRADARWWLVESDRAAADTARALRKQLT
ncbi:4'-phosphopantetheinyl transferase family protein [Actinokineospora sp.]|uniref:4'-phosphopantetheinyl transferase family protein n=1 Tax=Actinokineospora sp. TaxID=1872133 RepID=UPI004037C78E